MPRRIFIALSISENLKKKIGQFQQKYQHLPVRWLDSAGLHLTLIPPWYVSDLDKAQMEFLNIKDFFKPMVVDFHSFSFGPDPREPRLIWLEGKFSQELFEFKQKIEQYYGFRPEKRAFIPHITVARFQPEKFASFSLKNLNGLASSLESFTTFCLFESVLSPGGAQYEVIARIE